MPDQLVSTTVIALLKIARVHPQHRIGAVNAIVALVTEIVSRFKRADRECLLSLMRFPLNGSSSIRRPLAICACFPWAIQSHHLYPIRLEFPRMVFAGAAVEHSVRSRHRRASQQAPCRCAIKYWRRYRAHTVHPNPRLTLRLPRTAADRVLHRVLRRRGTMDDSCAGAWSGLPR